MSLTDTVPLALPRHATELVNVTVSPMAMRAIVRLYPYFDSTDVQLYNCVSCEVCITRFKEVRSKRTVCVYVADRAKRNRVRGEYFF